MPEPQRVRRPSPETKPQAKPVQQREGKTVSPPIGFLQDPLESLQDPRYWPQLQREVGNQALTRALQADLSVQLAPASPTSSASNDQGGIANVTDLEQDMRDILIVWRGDAHKGVDHFVTNALSSRLDSIESGSWKTFLLSFYGNTVWALTAFSPFGFVFAEAATALLATQKLAFGVSMAGITVAAAPAIPQNSESGIPLVQKFVDDCISGVFEALNPLLEKKASALLAQYPGITRYRALAEFVKNNFTPAIYTIDPGYSTIPTLKSSVISNIYESTATQRLEIAQNLGSKKGSYLSPIVTEVAWIRGPTGKLRLAIIESKYPYGEPRNADENKRLYGTSPPVRIFKEWVAPGNVDATIAQWETSQLVYPAIYAASEIDELSG